MLIFYLMKNEEMFLKLVESLKSQKPLARIHTLQLIFEMSPSRALPYIIDAIDDKSSKVRARAVKLLGKSKEPEAIKAIMKMKEDGDAKVQASVKSSLKKRINRKILKEMGD